MSSKIIKGLDRSFDCRLIELRHIFKEEDIDLSEAEGNGETEPAIDYEKLAALMMREAEEKALKLIDEAKKNAAGIEEASRERAGEEAERLKHEAARDGFEEGKKEALAKAAADASFIRDQARSVLRQAEEVRRQTIESLESDIVKLAIEMTEKILSVKLNLEPRVIVEIAKEAIGMLHNRDQVVLYVNPSDVDLYEEKRGDLTKTLSPKGELIIIRDPDIETGGCIAETENGRVDATLDSRWKTLLESLGEIEK
ncbi:MAG: FliH/SctL family protein [Firmicutes bacterium]|nr:FliH/SctL family protein [Bacillota bacterium]